MKKLFAYVLLISCSALYTGCASPLVTAVFDDDTRAVQDLLDKGTDVNGSAGAGSRETPLFYAAYWGRSESVRLLIERGADVNKSSPLSAAAYSGHATIVELLIEKGAEIDLAIREMGKSTPLHSATRKAEGIALLKKYGRQQPAGQPGTIASRSSREVSPVVRSDIDELPAVKSRSNNDSYAIVIGIENYHQKLPSADFAARDAQAVTDYLTKALGYPSENVVTLMNGGATNAAMTKYIEKWLPNNVAAGSRVFMYYSGHGAPNPRTGDAYLVPYDGDPAFIEETGYSLRRLYASLGKLPAKEVIVALDSCFSGTGGRSVIAKGLRPLVMNLQTASVPENVHVLAASAGDQTSATYDDKGHGLFTYFLLKGIMNKDVVRPDGSLDISLLYDYIKPQVTSIARKKYNNEQTPQLIESKR